MVSISLSGVVIQVILTTVETRMKTDSSCTQISLTYAPECFRDNVEIQSARPFTFTSFKKEKGRQFSCDVLFTESRGRE